MNSTQSIRNIYVPAPATAFTLWKSKILPVLRKGVGGGGGGVGGGVGGGGGGGGGGGVGGWGQIIIEINRPWSKYNCEDGQDTSGTRLTNT